MAKPTTETHGLLEDERRGRRGPKGRDVNVSGRAWKGSLGDRLLVARKLPQAVLKISSHNTGKNRVRAKLHYISRQGALGLETDQGIALEGLEEIDTFVDDWAVDFPNQKNSRDAMSLVISLPAGTDKTKATQAAREFFAEAFAENHEYAFAGHDDTDNFHIHVVAKSRGRDGKPMRPSRRDPQLWRQAFAEKARERGIQLDASPRTTRGVGRRTSPTSRRRPLSKFGAGMKCLRSIRVPRRRRFGERGVRGFELVSQKRSFVASMSKNGWRSPSMRWWW